MSAFLGSPARGCAFIEILESDPSSVGQSQSSDMDDPSPLGSKSPTRRGRLGSPFQRWHQNRPHGDSLLPSGRRRFVQDDDGAAASEGDASRGGQSAPSVRDRSSFDGASVDQSQRSLAMSMEFFDAEEALESASDISTQPDDSMSLRERLQQEIRARIAAQETLAALQAERNELLERLQESNSKREPSDKAHSSMGQGSLRTGAEDSKQPSESAVDGGIHSATPNSLEESGRLRAEAESESVGREKSWEDLGRLRELAEGQTGLEDQAQLGGEKSTAAGQSAGDEEPSVTSGKPLEAQKGAGGTHTETAGEEGVEEITNASSRQKKGTPSLPVSVTKAASQPEGAQKHQQTSETEGRMEEGNKNEAGPSRGVEPETEPSMGVESKFAEGGSSLETSIELGVLRHALVKKDAEIARLKEKLDYWDRVNEEYRIQREEAKEMKREERRRYRRQRAWTLGLLGVSAGVCIIGCAAYGAYRYWDYDFSLWGANGGEDAPPTSSNSTDAATAVEQGGAGVSRVAKSR